MTILGNLIWFILGGFIIGLLYILLGLFYCITIIGIPFGWQIMRLGTLSMWPFGRDIEFKKPTMGCVGMIFNIMWISFGGLELAVLHLMTALFFYITIIGIPFGNQHVKLAKLALAPFSQSLT